MCCGTVLRQDRIAILDPRPYPHLSRFNEAPAGAMYRTVKTRKPPQRAAIRFFFWNDHIRDATFSQFTSLSRKLLK